MNKGFGAALLGGLVMLGVGCGDTARISQLEEENQSLRSQVSATNDSYVENTLRCNQLYELKKGKLWGENIGQSKVIYNKTLGTCLAFNLYSYPLSYAGSETYFGTVVDLGSEKTLLYYTNEKGGGFVHGESIKCERSFDYIKYSEDGKEMEEYGCDKFGLLDKMFEIIRSYGFEVFSG